MKSIKHIIILFLLFLLSSCDKLPSSWGSGDLNPLASDSVEYDENFVYVNANEASWTDSGTVYNSEYTAIINVFENVVGYPTINGAVQGIASGTVSLCLPEIPAVFESHQVRDSHYDALGILAYYSYHTETTQTAPARPYRSCFYTNGMPLSGTSGRPANDGRVEYLISNSQPSSSASGNIISGTVSFKGEEKPGAMVQHPQDGKIWVRIIDSSTYQDNIGRYKVVIMQPKSTSSPSSFLSKYSKLVISPITRQVDFISESMFETGSHSAVFKNIIRVSLILYIVLYGFTFVMGHGNFTHKDLISRVFKIGIVITLISDTGINFFNDYLFDLFKNGQKELINVIANPSLAQVETGKLNYDSLFGFANYAITHIFSFHLFSLMVSFILWFPIGWVCLVMLFYSIVVYVFAILEVMIFYAIAYTAIGILIGLGPIFISLILFKRTRGLFDGWIAAIVSYTMQPVIMFAGVMLITAFVNDTIYNLLSLKIKSTPVLPIFIEFKDLGRLDLFTIYWLNPIAPTLQVLTDIIIFYIFINLLKKFSTLSGDLSSSIFAGTDGASKLASGITGGFKSLASTAVGVPVQSVKELYDSYKERRKREGVTRGGRNQSDSYNKNVNKSGISVAYNNKKTKNFSTPFSSSKKTTNKSGISVSSNKDKSRNLQSEKRSPKTSDDS